MNKPARSISTRLRAALLAMIVGLTAMIGTAVAAAPAEARVARGCYTLSYDLWGGHYVSRAYVNGGLIRIGSQPFRFVQTRAGGHTDIGVNRLTFVKRGQVYRGTVYVMGIPGGPTKLAPRRC